VKFYSELLAKAGLLERRQEITLVICGIGIAIVLLGYAFTGVWGLSLCIALLGLAILLEVLRLRGEARQRAFDASWPQVFDTFQSGAISGIGFREQLDYLSQKGPIALRGEFLALLVLYDQGLEINQLMPLMSKRFANRHADLLALLIELDSELGGQGMSITYQRAAVQVRKEQGELSQLQAKQGWVSSSAKLALLAPWLVALVLVQLPQNRAAFATELGSLILILGLALSLVAYAVVNRLGRLPLPGRVLNGIQ
jgi:tight adherence protein B